MSNALLVRFSDATTATEVERKSLKEIAAKLGVTETKAVHIAINRLYRDLFREDREFDTPSEKELQILEGKGLIQRCKPGEKSQQLADFFGVAG